MRVESRLSLARAGVLLLALLLGMGCRQDMHDQPKVEPLEASGFFANGMASRPLPPGTVARGHLREDTRLYEGKDAAGQLLTEIPVPVNRELVLRGRQRYEIFCSVCHDSLGTGRGMIVRRGFQSPPSFHEARLIEMPVGHFFDVMTNGFGAMSSYARQVPVRDRWAIAAYLRTLQLSQARRLADLPAAMQQEFHRFLESGPGDAHGGVDHGDHH